MKVIRDLTMIQLQEQTHDCDEFWDVIVSQKLDNSLEQYLIDFYLDSIPDLGNINDLLRYEGESVLKAIGANLKGTVWDD